MSNEGKKVKAHYRGTLDDGTQFELDACGLHIKVVEIAEHRIEQTLVCRLGETQPAKQTED